MIIVIAVDNGNAIDNVNHKEATMTMKMTISMSGKCTDSTTVMTMQQQ